MVKYANNKEVREKIYNHIMSYFDDMQAVKNQITYIINPSIKDARTYETLICAEKLRVNDAIKKMVHGGMFLVYDHDIIDFLVSLKITDSKGYEKTRAYYEDMNNVLEYYSKLIQSTLNHYL